MAATSGGMNVRAIRLNPDSHTLPVRRAHTRLSRLTKDALSEYFAAMGGKGTKHRNQRLILSDGRKSLLRHRRQRPRCGALRRRRGAGRADLCSIKWGPQAARSLVSPETSIEGPAVVRPSKHNELFLIGANAKMRQNTSKMLRRQRPRCVARKRKRNASQRSNSSTRCCIKNALPLDRLKPFKTL